MLFLGVAGLLVGAFVLQLLPKRLEARFAPQGALKDLIPSAAEGWTARDLPLGETEAMVKVVADALRYDDYVYRVYQRGTVEVGVYIAYWKPGTTDRIEVGSHSPDKCWVQSGWNRIGEEHEARFQIGDRTSELGQVRHFRKSHVEQHVVFWHLVGGVRSGYAQGEQSRWGTRAPALVRSLLGSQLGLVEQEQYFIRISSNVPVDALQKEAFFSTLLRATVQFGVCGGA